MLDLGRTFLQSVDRAAAAIALVDAALLWRVLELGPIAMTMGNWLPPFGISFTVDIVGAVFALLQALSYLGRRLVDEFEVPQMRTIFERGALWAAR